MRKNYLLLIITLSIFLISHLFPAQKKLLVEETPGHKFAGGSPPKIVGVKKVKTIYKNNKPFTIYKVTFRRAGLDNGEGWYPSLKAKTWGDLLKSKKLERDVIAVKWIREKNVDAKWNDKFPTLKCYIKYLIAFKTDDGWHLNRTWVKKGKGKIRKNAVRERHSSSPKKLITEYLVKGLPPGSHKLELRAATSYDRKHIMTKGMTLAKLIAYLFLGKSESVVTEAVIKYSTITVAVYTLHVPVKTPRVEGKTIKEARQIINNHSLKVFNDPEYTGDLKKDGKVRLQDPVAGTMLNKGDQVGLTYYQYSPELDENRKAESLAGVWKWTTTCGRASFSGTFTIILSEHGSRITGSFSNGHYGEIRGIARGNGFKFTRTFNRGKQLWTGDLINGELTGKVTDQTHTKLKISTVCTFTATR